MCLLLVTALNAGKLAVRSACNESTQHCLARCSVHTFNCTNSCFCQPSAELSDSEGAGAAMDLIASPLASGVAPRRKRLRLAARAKAPAADENLPPLDDVLLCPLSEGDLASPKRQRVSVSPHKHEISAMATSALQLASPGRSQRVNPNKHDVSHILARGRDASPRRQRVSHSPDKDVSLSDGYRDSEDELVDAANAGRCEVG